MVTNFLQGRFLKHPLHPFLVHLPVGLWVGSLIFDILYYISGSANFAVTSYYCMAFGIIGALLAVPAGLADFLSIAANSKARTVAMRHMTMNFIIAGLFVINFFSRRGTADGVPTTVTTGAFVLSIVSVVMLMVSGYLGGLLVYQFGIGYRPELRDKGETRRAA